MANSGMIPGTALPEYLKSIGFEPLRINIRKPGMPREVATCKIDFSTMPQDNSGQCYLDVRWIKDGVEIVWGLHECGKPPTLIHPRPVIVPDDPNISDNGDDPMNRVLSKYSAEEIFTAMFNRQIRLTP